MPRRPVFTNVMTVVERRIAEGDYMLKDLPGERKLAEELGVSYLTARKAVLKLIEKKVLSRRENGSLIIHPHLKDRRTQPSVALLVPAYPSVHFLQCRTALTQAAVASNARFRAVEYVHWNDPVVNEAVKGSDGLFVIPSTEPLPDNVLKLLTSPANKVVFFDDDMSEHGLPSIRLFAEAHIEALFEHLYSLGHRRVDCLNAQGHNLEIDRRIEQWRGWTTARGIKGHLWDVPAPAYTDPTVQAYDAMKRALAAPPHALSALVCTTQPAALGVMRACYEAGVKVGRDVSVCTINNEPTGWHLCPSLTGLEMPDVTPLLRRCFDWFAKPAHERFRGDARMVPPAANLYRGESTGTPTPASA